MHSEPLLELRNLSMRFGDFVALDDVSMRVAPGSFHALLGENGAGKSTLVKCAIGYQRATSGAIRLRGEEVAFRSTREAHQRGLGMVYQRFTLVDNMTVAENLVLVRDNVPAVIRWPEELKALDSFMAQMPFRLPLSARVDDLAAGEKQKLEILKQLYLQRTLLFLDEPTSVLTPHEADEVLTLLHDLTRKGGLTVVMITHKFREVMGYADHVSILRRGRLVESKPLAALDVPEMSRLMVGSATLRVPAARVDHPEQPALRLELRGLVAEDDGGAPALRALSLSVRAGEIVGIAGVSGNGQRELVEAICGQRKLQRGSIRVAGQAFSATRQELRARRVSVVPEVPLENAAVAQLSVSDNLALRDFDVAPIARFGFVRKRQIRALASQLISAFHVKTATPDAPMRELSGGNIQRAVLARELSRPTDLLIAANPCFGLDFATSAEIRAKLIDARNRGAGVLLISEDLDELLELSERLLVMFDGRIVFETAPKQTDTAELGSHMAGHVA